ncbi:MAG: PilN domain-containing protein [Gammaproteobacteria bacterium]
MSQQINLYNPAFERRRQWLSLNILGAALAALVLLFAVAAALTGMRNDALARQERASAGQLAQLKAQASKMTAQVGARQKDPRLLEELGRVQADLDAGAEVLAVLQGGALGNTAGYSEYLRAFARQSFDGLWLTGFSIAGAGHDVTIQGRALRAELVPDYLKRLNRERIMQGRAFSELSMELPKAQVDAKTQPERAGYLEFRLSTQADAAAKTGTRAAR